MSIQEILKILTDSGIEPNEANAEVKMLLEHFANYGVKDIVFLNYIFYKVFRNNKVVFLSEFLLTF